ncbi:hypothetical protein LJC32_06420 [Oscillospiraceae bacterium OttesenSCG-928-F05]|nr:hypothetical protein [Oscillospiraceae bacterium OttesenSCG-928-F05]
MRKIDRGDFMPKTPLEKEIEKQTKQAKQLADRQRKDEQKKAREAVRASQKEATRTRAASIVNGQPIVEGFRIMDSTAEEMLHGLLQCEQRSNNHINFDNDIFPGYVQMSMSLELEKLVQYGMIGGLMAWSNGGMLNLLPPALTYFENKDAALELQKKKSEEKQMQGITNYGNMVFGNVSGSTLSVDNSIHQLEKDIEEQGGEDKEDLLAILEEVKELIENIESSRSIPKQKKLFERINGHLVKHGWFYGAVVQLLGTAAMTMLGA